MLEALNTPRKSHRPPHAVDTRNGLRKGDAGVAARAELASPLLWQSPTGIKLNKRD